MYHKFTHAGRQCHSPLTTYGITYCIQQYMGLTPLFLLHKAHSSTHSQTMPLTTYYSIAVPPQTCATLSDQYTCVHRPRVRWQKGGEAGCGRSKKAKAYSTSTSRVVPHHSTTLAVHRLTSRFGWDVVYSASCGRKHLLRCLIRPYPCVRPSPKKPPVGAQPWLGASGGV